MSDILCFWTPWQFWGLLVRCFVKDLNFFFKCFSFLNRREERSQRKAVLLTAYQGYLFSTWLVTVDINLDHLAKVVFVRFLHCKVPSCPLSIMYSLEGSHYLEGIWRGGELCTNTLRHEHLPKLFGIFLHGRFVEKTILSSFHWLCAFVKNQLTIFVWVCLWALYSVPFTNMSFILPILCYLVSGSF